MLWQLSVQCVIFIEFPLCVYLRTFTFDDVAFLRHGQHIETAIGVPACADL